MSGNAYQQEMTWICGQDTSSVLQQRFWQHSKNESILDLADSGEDGEKQSEFRYIKTVELTVYSVELKVRMWEKEGGKDKPKVLDLNHKKDRIARSSVSGMLGLRSLWDLQIEIPSGHWGLAWREEVLAGDINLESSTWFDFLYLCWNMSKNDFIFTSYWLNRNLRPAKFE